MSTFAIDTYTGNGSTTSYSVTFPYITTADVIVTINGVTKTLTTHYTFSNSSTISFGSAPANGEVIKITRSSNRNARLVDYQDGSTLTEASLDQDGNQAFFMAQEAIDITTNNLSLSNSTDQWDAESKRITNVADPTSAQDAATKNYLENTFLTTANKTALTTVNANIANINAVNSNSSNINSAVSNATNINTVATNIGSVNTVATDISKVIAVANDLAEAVSEVETVADDLNEATSEIDTVATSITNVDTVGNNIANVNTVAGISSNVTTVAGISSDITTVRGINLAISNVSNISNDVTAVNGNSSNINTVAGNNSNISTVAGISGNVTTVAGISSDVTSVANDATDIGTVAGISSDVTSVAGISSAVSAVNSNSSNINAVNSNSANINTVAGNNTNINTVAGVSSDVTTVAGISSDVQAVENIASNVTTVAGMSTAINTANSNSSNINTVAGAITNVNNVGGSIANVNTVAGNLSGVNSFGERYRVSSSAPTSSLNSGDLWFDSTNNILKVYGASGFQSAGSSVNGLLDTFKYTVSSSTTTISGADDNSNTLAYDANKVSVFLNGIRMVTGTDITATNGTSIVFASAIGATGTDIVEIEAFGTFSVANMNASNLTSGTVPDARITGAYTGITNLTIDTNTGDANNPFVSFDNNDGNIGQVRMSSSGDFGFRANTGGTGNMFFQTGGGSERMRILSDGKLGLGTSNPSPNIGSDNVLEIAGASAPGLVINDTGQAEKYAFHALATKLNMYYGNTAFFAYDASNSKLGIHTDNPLASLHVDTSNSGVTPSVNADDLFVESSGSTGITIGSGTGNFGRINFGDSGDANIGIIQYEHTTNAMAFTTNASERMRIDSSGNLLVGKTVTTANTAGTQISSATGVRATVDGNVATILNRTASDGDIALFRKDNITVGSIFSRSGLVSGIILDPRAGGNGLLGQAGCVIPVDENQTREDNATDWGRSDFRWKDLYLGGGVYLGGTGTANKLDDYETGTWTVKLCDASSGGNEFGYTGSRTGNYTKIGDTVIAIFYARTDGSTSGITTSNQLFIQGLPFTCNAHNNSTTVISSTQGTLQSTLGAISAQVMANSSYIRFRKQYGDTSAPFSVQALLISEWEGGSGANVQGTIIYKV